MPQFDIIHNQAVKHFREDRPVQSASALGDAQPRMLSNWRPRVQAWRQVRKPMQSQIVSEWVLERRAS